MHTQHTGTYVAMILEVSLVEILLAHTPSRMSLFQGVTTSSACTTTAATESKEERSKCCFMIDDLTLCVCV